MKTYLFKLKKFLKELIKSKNIKNRVMRLLITISLTSFIFCTILGLYGMLTVKNEMELMGKQLESSATAEINSFLVHHNKNELLGLVNERARQMDTILNQMMQDVQVVSLTMTDILEHPERYSPQQRYRPNSIKDGWSIGLLLTPSAAENFYGLQNEIAMAANIQSVLKNTALNYKFPMSIQVAMERGFQIEADTNEEDMNLYYFENPNPYYVFNYQVRPWYVKAKAENRTVFTDSFADGNPNREGAVMLCATPINANSEFVGVVGLGFAISSISDVVLKTSIGKTGFAFIMNDNGQVIISPKKEGTLSVNKNELPDLRQSAEPTLAIAAKLMSRGNIGISQVVVDGEEYFLAFTPLENVDWNFGVMIESEEIFEPAKDLSVMIREETQNFISNTDKLFAQMTPLTAICLIVLFGISSALSSKLSKHFVKPIYELSDNVREIASGNLDKKIDIHTGDEIEHLAACFNAMTSELKDYMKNLTKVTAEKERIATEVNVAKDIQHSMLPHDFNFERKDFDIFATMDAAKGVGGDFYDFYLLDENHLAMTIGDVSGKGIPASLFMVISKTVLKNFTTFATAPDDYAAVVENANNQLCQGNEEMMFVTVFFGVLEIDTGKFVYVNGGHNPPIIYHAESNSCEYLSVKKNFVLGGMEEVPYNQQEITLQRGDLIFTYTDGVNEAMNEQNEEYTSERLLNFMNSTDCRADLKTLLAVVKADVAKHVGAAEQSDDITMLALRRN